MVSILIRCQVAKNSVNKGRMTMQQLFSRACSACLEIREEIAIDFASISKYGCKTYRFKMHFGECFT